MDRELGSILLACLHQAPDQFPAADLAALTAEEWRSVFQTAAEQGVVGLLYYALKTRGALGMAPDEIAGDMRAVYRRQAGRNMRFYAEMKPITLAFQAAGIPLIGLKGIVLAGLAYDNLALRCVGDVDLMVPRAQLIQAAELMPSLGYQSIRPYSVAVDVAQSHHLTRFAKPGAPPIELHWTITEPNWRHRIGEAELWTRAQAVRLPGVELLSLSPEDLLLHLCLHTSYQHQFAFGLRTICDIAQVLRYYGSHLDWAAVRARAKRWERGVHLALRAARAGLGAAVPDEVLRALEPDDFPEALVTTALAQMLAGPRETASLSPKLARAWGERTLAGKGRELLKSVFISRVALAKRYALPLDSPRLYLYYAVRIWNLLRDHTRKAQQLRRKESVPTQIAERMLALQAWLSDAYML